MKLYTLVTSCYLFSLAAGALNQDGYDPEFVEPVDNVPLSDTGGYPFTYPNRWFGFRKTYDDMHYRVYFNTKVLNEDPHVFRRLARDGRAPSGDPIYQVQTADVTALRYEDRNFWLRPTASTNSWMFVVPTDIGLRDIPNAPKSQTGQLYHDHGSDRWYMTVKGLKDVTWPMGSISPGARPPMPMKQIIAFASAHPDLVDEITVNSETYSRSWSGTKIYRDVETIVWRRPGLIANHQKL